MLNSYAYTDQLLSLPDDFKDQETDIVADIEGIKAEDFDNYYDFNRALSKATYKVRDSHFNYFPPCFSNFANFFPFMFEIRSGSSGEYMLVAVEANNDCTKVWLNSDPNNIDLRGKTITKLVLPDLDPIENETAAVTFSRWGQKYSSLRTPFGRQSWAIQNDFSTRRSCFFDPPSGRVQITYINDENKEMTTEVPFIGFTSSLDPSPDVICPFESSSSFVSLNNKSIENIKNRNKKENKIINEIMNQHNNNINDISEDPLIAARLREIRRNYERLEKEGKLDDFKDNNGTKPHRLNEDEYSNMNKKDMNDLNRERESVQKEKNGDNKSNINNNQDVDSRTYFYLGDSDGVSYVVYPYYHIIMFSIPTWVITDEETYFGIIVKGLELRKKFDCNRLILNKIGNTGGYSNYADFLLSTLFPIQYSPNYVASFPASETNLLCESYLIEGRQVLSYPENKRLKKTEEYKPYRNVTVKGEIGGEKIARTRAWSRKYYSMMANYVLDTVAYEDEEVKKLLEEKRFSPENTIVLLDGVCVSACAVFTKFVSENKLATIVNLGDVLYNPDNKKSDIGDACSEEVVELETVYKRQAELKTNYSLPKRFKRSFGNIRFPVGGTYSINKNEENTLMEYKVIQPDVISKEFVDYKSLRDPKYLAKLVEKYSTLFYKCVSWNVKVNSSCEAPSKGEKIQHALYGNPCNSEISAFDTSKCVFARCENGYYLKDGKCEKIPKLDYDKGMYEKYDKVLTVWAICCIVLICVIFVGIIVCVTLCICCACKKRRNYSTIN